MCANFSVRFADGVAALKNTCEIHPRVNVVPRWYPVLAWVSKPVVMLEAKTAARRRGKKCKA
jgi:hypothetical protein